MLLVFKRISLEFFDFNKFIIPKIFADFSNFFLQALCGFGNYKESRFCLNPAPANGGTPCNRDKKRQITCNLPECGSCTDHHRDCEGYEKMNYCKEGLFVEWMKQTCKKI